LPDFIDAIFIGEMGVAMSLGGILSRCPKRS